jgi:hypothetical protein
MSATVSATPPKRSTDGTTHHNGHRTRALTTPAGDRELHIPKLRTGSFFPSLLDTAGPAGAYVHDFYARVRAVHFPDQLPIVIGITAYGHCAGVTRGDWQHGPRISVESRLFDLGRRQVDDLLLHEMLHVALILAGQHRKHAGDAWYSEVRRLSPVVLGQELDVRPGAGRRSVRVPNPDLGPGKPATVVRKMRNDDAVPHRDVASGPQTFRPEDTTGPSRSTARPTRPKTACFTR